MCACHADALTKPPKIFSVSHLSFPPFLLNNLYPTHTHTHTHTHTPWTLDTLSAELHRSDTCGDRLYHRSEASVLLYHQWTPEFQHCVYSCSPLSTDCGITILSFSYISVYKPNVLCQLFNKISVSLIEICICTPHTLIPVSKLGCVCEVIPVSHQFRPTGSMAHGSE